VRRCASVREKRRFHSVSIVDWLNLSPIAYPQKAIGFQSAPRGGVESSQTP